MVLVIFALAAPSLNPSTAMNKAVQVSGGRASLVSARARRLGLAD